MNVQGLKVSTCIIMQGLVYTLTTKEESHPNSKVMHVCKLCGLRGECDPQTFCICDIFDAAENEYFVLSHFLENNENLGIPTIKAY